MTGTSIPKKPADASARDYSRCNLSAAVCIGRQLVGIASMMTRTWWHCDAQPRIPRIFCQPQKRDASDFDATDRKELTQQKAPDAFARVGGLIRRNLSR